MILGNAAIVIQDMLRKAPKPLNAVNVIFRFLVDHALRVIDLVMLSPALQRIVALELVRVVDRPFPRFLFDNSHELLSRDPLDHPRVDPPIALQKAKNDAFALCSSSALSFSPAAKVALIHFNLARELAALKLRYMVDRFTQALVDARHRLVITSKIVSELVRRLLLIEALQDPKLSSQLCERLLFAAALVPAANVTATGPGCLERTAENALPPSQKVGRTTENVLLPICHMDILTPYGYDYH